VNPLYASIDLGGTNLSAALAEADGTVVAHSKQPTHSYQGPAAVLDRIASVLNQLTTESGRKPSALGVGVPGLVDVGSGVTRFLPNFPTQWRDVPVRAILQPKVGCPVFILNDARVATLGELVFGHGRSARSMVYFGLGTGVGGGVVINGQLRLGPLGAAGELGHQTILPDGPLCLETLVSGPALTAEGVRLLLSGNAPKLYELCQGDVTKVSPSTLAAAATAGEKSALVAIERAGEWLGIGAANLIVALHPDLIVVGGGVSEMGDLLLNPVRETIRRRVGMLPTTDIRVAQSQLGDKAGLMGGIALALRGGVKAE
jgi:glucokinase